MSRKQYRFRTIASLVFAVALIAMTVYEALHGNYDAMSGYFLAVIMLMVGVSDFHRAYLAELSLHQAYHMIQSALSSVMNKTNEHSFNNKQE